MAIDSKRRLMFTTAILTILLLYSAYAIFVPNVHAAETTIKQEGVAVTNNVIGVDVAKYTTVSEDYRQDSLYMDVIPQENLRYTIETDGSKLDLYYTFVNGQLQKIHVLEVQGSLQMQKSLTTNSFENAKDFLSNYQGYSENTFYGELSSTLNTIDSTKNETKTYGNIKLAATTYDNSATYKWTYTFNGIDAPDKCVALHYENGFLSYFIDNWDIYTIGSTNVNLSEQEAIDIAMAKAEDFTWATVVDNETFTDLKYKVTNAMVWQTIFSNSIFMDNQRGQDPLTLYPMRHIWVSFDKFYPCNVYGMNVYVWADTGEIGHLQERFSTVDPPADLMVTNEDLVALASVDQSSEVDVAESSLFPWMLIASFAALTLGTGTIWLSNKILPKSCGLTKLRSKIGGVLLCLLIASTVLFSMAIPIVNALPHYGRAHIWGSESSDAWNSTYNLSWRKHPDEVTRQELTASFLRSKFYNNGYSAVNSQGTHGYTSYKNNILSRIDADQSNYARVAVVDFDHGNGLIGIPGLDPEEFHFMFEDQRGTMSTGIHHPAYPPDHPEYAVFDYNIYPETDMERHFFVFINACNSAYIGDKLDGEHDSSQGMADGGARGMPYAWSHGIEVLPYPDPTPDPGYMSGDGYTDPDNGDFCYIGFHYGSAALTQSVTGLSSPSPYWYWLEHFFAYALTNNLSVKQALNEASQQFYQGNFGEIPLHTGYTSVWPMFYSDDPGEWRPPWYGEPYWHTVPGKETGPGSLRVYGNSHIKLYQPLLTLSANNGLSPEFTISNQESGSNDYDIGDHRLISDFYSISVKDIPNYDFSHFTYKDTTYGSNPTLQIASDSELKAYYTWNPVYYDLTISAGTGGTTMAPYPPDDYEILSYETVHVVADPDDDWALDHWILDTENAGNDLSIDVLMDKDHTLEAVFTPAPSYNYVASIHSYGGAVYNQANLVGWQSDSQFAHLEGYGYYGVTGWIAGTMDDQASGHIYVKGRCVSGGATDLYVYVSSNGYNWNSVSSPYVSSTSAYWIDCGTYGGTFNYIKVLVQPAGWGALELDSVRVEP